MANRNAQDYLETEHPRLFSYIDVYPTAPDIIDLETAGQWYTLTATWAEFLGTNFTLTPVGGCIRLDGPDAIFKYIAHFVASVDKSCKITAGTFINDILITQTELTFGAAETEKRMLRTRLASLVTLDASCLKVKSDTANTEITIREGRVTFK